ncbi:hypothetical protein GXW71_10485 [Roseomonas hellenica]|uniref:Lipoprotein n=1 Tax=Plastoroseomonas hellenica TaxID=2687306 RepID=A0ABS5EWU7_9PROT|nr:hypothetical protein [Plastoroseomonas hellenica]MBR0664777.1 hypothetical protein [Plastoroseomonas hellenica]
MGKVLLLLLLPFLVACADRGTEFDARMANYVGRSEGELVAGLGVPHRAQEVEGRRFLDYELDSTSGPSITPSLGFGLGFGSGFAIGIGSGVIFGHRAADCSVTFELQQGRVQSFARRGSGCA